MVKRLYHNVIDAEIVHDTLNKSTNPMSGSGTIWKFTICTLPSPVCSMPGMDDNDQHGSGSNICPCPIVCGTFKCSCCDGPLHRLKCLYMCVFVYKQQCPSRTIVIVTFTDLCVYVYVCVRLCGQHRFDFFCIECLQLPSLFKFFCCCVLYLSGIFLCCVLSLPVFFFVAFFSACIFHCCVACFIN